ncbi:MAG TPA: peptidoglycan-binding domain-containing protein [Hyphomicrobiaceae bacterium]|nr:peptidoglycan-binding domain-containing protein [Hyphomicrobiaceae bacterium]
MLLSKLLPCLTILAVLLGARPAAAQSYSGDILAFKINELSSILMLQETPGASPPRIVILNPLRHPKDEVLKPVEAKEILTRIEPHLAMVPRLIIRNPEDMGFALDTLWGHVQKQGHEAARYWDVQQIHLIMWLEGHKEIATGARKFRLVLMNPRTHQKLASDLYDVIYVAPPPRVEAPLQPSPTLGSSLAKPMPPPRAPPPAVAPPVVATPVPAPVVASPAPQPTPPKAPPPPAAAKPAPTVADVENIRTLQRELRNRGCFSGDTTGVMDAKTIKALTDFNKVAAQPVDVHGATLPAIARMKRQPTVRCGVVAPKSTGLMLSKSSSREDILDLEDELRARGCPVGSANGAWTIILDSKVKGLQQDGGLPLSGTVSAGEVLSKLKAAPSIRCVPGCTAEMNKLFPLSCSRIVR